jgi:hypothetical protein
MRVRNWCLFVALATLLAVLPTVSLAQDYGVKDGQYALEGTWWRVHTASPYNATINRDGAATYNVMFAGFPNTPGIAGLPPTTQVTRSPGVIERVGVNEYEFTWILWYGDEKFDLPYRGTVYAVVCWGPLVQDTADHFYFDNSCFASINPCYYGWDAARCAALGPDLWDPFTDPKLIPAPPPPQRLEYQRVPLLRECPTPD